MLNDTDNSIAAVIKCIRHCIHPKHTMHDKFSHTVHYNTALTLFITASGQVFSSVWMLYKAYLHINSRYSSSKDDALLNSSGMWSSALYRSSSVLLMEEFRQIDQISATLDLLDRSYSMPAFVSLWERFYAEKGNADEQRIYSIMYEVRLCLCHRCEDWYLKLWKCSPLSRYYVHVCKYICVEGLCWVMISDRNSSTQSYKTDIVTVLMI